MADEVKPEPSRKPEDVRIDVPGPAPAPDPEAERVAQHRAYVKDTYGIEDDPEEFKKNYQKVREAAQQLPQYDYALRRTLAALQQMQTLGANLPAGPGVAPGGDPFEAIIDDEDRMRELARVDPYRAYKLLQKKAAKDYEERIGRLEQSHNAYVGHQTATTYGARLRDEWPEVYEQGSDLHQMGSHIYHNEMTDWDRRNPAAFYVATERAAGRLGLAPKSRRKPPASERGDISHEVESQSPERRGTRKSDADDDAPKPTARQSRMISEMSIDPKVFSQAKKARSEKKNIRVGE